MLNVCYHCGEYRADKTIDPSGPYAICPECGHQHAFRQLPLLIVGGASGAGKSAACQMLLGRIDEVVLLEGDLFWRPEFDKPAEKYRDFFETCLRVAKSISQSGRPVVMVNAGMGVPENVESCAERRYFSAVHYLALVCNDDVLVERLRARPQWRQSGDLDFIEAQVQFNRWFQENANNTRPKIDLLDTTGVDVKETAAQVSGWIRAHLAGVVDA